MFDRVRENFRKMRKANVAEVINNAITRTMSRTIMTHLSTQTVVISMLLFGGEILKGFSLAMIFGVIFGTYSSIYIANTILVRLNVSQKTVLREDDKN